MNYNFQVIIPYFCLSDKGFDKIFISAFESFYLKQIYQFRSCVYSEPIFYSKTDPLLRKIYDLIGRFWWDIDPLPHLFHGSLEYEPPPNMLLGS